MKKLFPAAVAALMGMSVAGGAIAAAKIEKIEAPSPTVTMEGGKATVKFTVGGSSDDRDNCGYWVDYGDGSNPDTRILSKSDGLFPRVMEHTFTKAGSFTVKVTGQRVKVTLGCNGEASSVINVVAPAAAAGAAKAALAAKAVAAAPAAPTCPDGWMVQAKSVDKKTGAFACGPKMPEKKMECGAALAYYETVAAVGCRKGK